MIKRSGEQGHGFRAAPGILTFQPRLDTFDQVKTILTPVVKIGQIERIKEMCV